MKTKFISKFGFIDSNYVNAILGRNARGPIIRIFERILPVIGLRVTPYRMSVICKVIQRIVSIHRTRGSKGLVLYMKTTTVLLQQCIGGHVLVDPGLISKTRVARAGKGFPKLIVSQDRALIKAGNTQLIRLYLTIFNIYRVIAFRGILKLHTITAPFAGDRGDPLFKELFSLIGVFAKLVLKEAKGSRLHTQKLFPEVIPRSGPGASGPLISSNPLVLVLTARRLEQTGLSPHVSYFLRKFDAFDHIPGIMSGQILQTFRRCCSLPFMPTLPSEEIPMGRLGFKEEAAGKVRAFAMVDAWTQWSLAPLHEEMFRILKHLPCDGTFDQLKPVLNYRAWPSAYSLDLTAATDRLPMDIQVELMSKLFGADLASHWKELLVDRDYLAVNAKYGVNTVVRYAVGQPMGALSSWASLALIHHAIVNISAWISGVTPKGVLYTNYAILGDDLVVGDYKVMRVYLRVCRVLGVEIGIHKSLMSRSGTTVEFAKRTLHNGVDVSPIPLEEFFSANKSLPSAMALALKYAMSLARLLKAFGYGYRVLGSLYRHVGKLSSRVRLLYMAFQVPLVDIGSHERFLQIGNPKIPESPEIIQAMISSFVSKASERLVKIAGGPNLGTLIRGARDKYLALVLDNRLINLLLGTLPAGPLALREPGTADVALLFGSPMERVFGPNWYTGGSPAVLQPFTFFVPDRVQAEAIKDTIEKWDTAIYSVVMLQFYSSDARRTEQLKDLLYKVSLFPRMVTLNMAYPRLIAFIKELDAYSSLNSAFLRDEAEPRVILTSKHLKIWAAWTKALNDLKIKTG